MFTGGKLGHGSGLGVAAAAVRRRTGRPFPQAAAPSLRRFTAAAALGIWLAGFTSGWAQPVILYLRSGDRLSGTIIYKDTNGVILATPWAKEIVVPATEILKRETPTASEAKAGQGKPAGPAFGALTNIDVRPGTLAVSGPLPPVKPNPPKHWGGEAQVGADMVFSERNRQLYSGRFKLTYAYNHFRNLFDCNFAYGKTDGLLSDDRAYGSCKTDYDLSPRTYVYNLGGVGFDKIRKIDLRYEIGPGMGYRVIKLTNFVLNAELGNNYQAQYNSDNTKSELFFYRLAENSTWTVNGHLSVDERVEFFPRVDLSESYRCRFESNFRYALVNHLAFVVTVMDQYDTQPAQGVAKNDLQLRSSISFKF
jgi:putative salt-induced outer membrane protein YdiY